MRGERRKGQARLRDRLALRRRGVGGADHAARGDAVEHAVARRARRLWRAIRPPRFGRLRQRDQQRRLGDGQPQRLLAEIGERGRAHALEIAAERSQREITVERSRLADVALDLERPRDLPELGGDRALGPRLDQPRDLHGQGRAARHHMAAHQPLRAGANERAKVDAVMLIKPPVLIGDEHRDIARIDVMRGRRQPPAAIGQSEGPEQPAVAIDDDRRALARGRKIERAEACGVARPGDGRAEARRRYERKQRGEDEGEAARKARHAAPSPGETLIRRFGATFSPREKGFRHRRSAQPCPGAKGRSASLLPRGEGGPKGRMRASRMGPRLTSPSPPIRQRRCGRSGRGRTCLRPSPADRCSGRARRRARHRPW